MKSILTMDQLKSHVENKKPNELILDIRTPEEFKEGHIRGARNIPHDQVDRHVAELKKYETVYMHCRSGGRVQMAAAVLEGLGVRNLACVVRGGMPDWEAAGYPVERG
jgi:rhodanese-related sulfurtransferase